MQNQLTDENIHKGHRSRMRAKLVAHGPNIFDSYELLEMLLYYAVPYKDTNPVAKRLLFEFGSLDGVFRAEKDELVGVSGIGERAAELIKKTAELAEVIGAEVVPEEKSIFSTALDAGGFFVDYFRGVEEKKVVAVYLDNNLDFISLEEIAVGYDYDSAAVKAKAFIDGAIRNNASVVMSAHNHPFGSPYPSPGDRATNSLIRDALEKIRVTLAEHFVIAGDRFVSTMQEFVLNFCQSPSLEDFINSKDDGERSYGISEETLSRLRRSYNTEDLLFLEELLSYRNADKAKEDAQRLLKRYRTVEMVLSATTSQLTSFVGEATAVYLKLLAYLSSRRVTDSFEFGKKYNECQITEYLKALYIGVSEEQVYLLSFDSSGRFVGSELVGLGTVNTSEVIPRRILEATAAHSAKKVIIAHNHPSGKAKASSDDLNFGASIKALLNYSGIELLSNCIIAGQRCAVIDGT